MQNLCLDPEFGRDPKLVVLIMGGGEHRFAADRKKVLQIYEGPFSIVAEARLELTTFGL